MNNWTQWGIGVGLTIGMAVTGYTIHRVDAVQLEANKTFVTKDQYDIKQVEICNSLALIMQRIDRNDERSEERTQAIQKMLREHENSAIKRDKAYK